jgi:hypothetical protein
MPELKLAERLGGIVSMAAAVRRKHYGRPHHWFSGWVFAYEFRTPGVEGGDNSTLQCGPDDDPQPDAYLLILPEYGGQCRFTADDYIVGAPEFIGEVSSSSVHRDLNTKLPLYRDHGVQEYVVWDTADEQITWFRREGEELAAAAPDADGIHRSRVFPGLWLDPAALVRGDMQRVLRVLENGLHSPEHAEFVHRLAVRVAARE